MRQQPVRLLPIAAAILAAGAAPAQDAVELPAVTVTAETPPEVFVVEPEETSITGPDAAALLRRVPGANVNRNGPLTGIAQYRGMFGPRVNVSVDGMDIPPACSNHMDPPLLYAPKARLESLEVYRGIAPVSSGLETIGGHVVAKSRGSQFTTSDAFELHGEAQAGVQSVDMGYSLGALASVANDRHRFHVGGSRETGESYAFPGGIVEPSEYERNVFDAGYGFRLGEHAVGIDYRKNATGNTGTPALPMDIVYFDADLIRGEYGGKVGELDLGGRVYYAGIDHKMSNYELRQPANPMMRRHVLEDSQGFGVDLDARSAVGPGTLAVGFGTHMAENDADIFDPSNPAFHVVNFNDAERDRYGLFAEWTGDLAPRWSTEVGLRWTRVDSDAGQVDSSMAQMMPPIRILRDRFNAADRAQTDDDIDWALKVFYELSPELKLEVGGARKTRAPSYQERYLWLPTEATAGLADGNNYVGDITLSPEVSHQVEVGIDWHMDRFYAAPRGFYRYVDDYIQGTPATDPLVIMVSTASGDPTPLQFSNVEAELYGFDMDFGVRITDEWRFDGVVSYVRGKRDDIDDDLYRIAPLNSTLALTYEQPQWSITAEGVLYAAQEKVSTTNDEQTTDGYQLLNLYGSYTPREGLVLTAGINNVLDSEYEDHLSGYNRVVDSDVPVGARIPGPGLSMFGTVSYAF